jgi:hypothetical protein
MDKNLFHQHQIKTANTFDQLVHASFKGDTNAMCWLRDLDGDFKEIVSLLTLKENITEVLVDDLLALPLSANGSKARAIILNDLALLTGIGASPALNLLKCYDRDEEFEVMATDVYSYHVDRSPIATDTFLCTYYGTASDILPNEQADQKILIPEIREQLIALHHGAEEEFETFLKEYFFDLHYQAKTNARPVNLGVGHLWRIAVDHPEQAVLPCIHRAPVENDGEYRLLLIC